MPLQKRLVAIGVGKQTALGAPAAEPFAWFGVKDGKPAQWEIDEDVIELTGDKPVYSEVDRTLVVPGAEFTSLLHPKMLGLLLYGALGSLVTTGAGPFTHVSVPANDNPYLTFWGRAFGGDYMRVEDCKIDELEISWENAGHVSLAMTAMGVVFNWGAVAPTPTNDESVGGTPLFRAAGGVFKVDPASGVPIERPVVSGSIKITNNTEAVPQSKSVQPSDVMPGVKDIEYTLTIAPNDLSDVRKAVTGGAAGTTIGNVPVYGSLDWLFTIDANTDLRIEAPRVQAMIEAPEADPAGGYLEVELGGKAVQPAAGDALKTTLRNTVAVY